MIFGVRELSNITNAATGKPGGEYGGPAGLRMIGDTYKLAKETAQGEYHVTFPIAAKSVVKGADAHPFYKWTAELRPRDVPRWNFHKILVGRDGRAVASYRSAIAPQSPPGLSASSPPRHTRTP